MERGANVSDWSWRRTARRITTLARLAAPYKRQTTLAIASLLTATLIALAPPYLAKLAVDGVENGRQHRLHRRHRRPLPRRRHRGPRRHLGADLLHRLDGRADPGRPPQPALQAPRPPLARLLRAQPRRRDHQPPHERRRGARPARHRRRHDPRPEHADPDRLGRHPLLPRLAARPRHGHGHPAHGRGDGALPRLLGPRLPRRPRAPRARHGDARRGHRRDARRPVVHARGDEPAPVPRGQRPLPRGQPPDGRDERPLLPLRRLPRDHRHGDRARLRRATATSRARSRSGRCSRSCSTCRTSSTRCSSSRSSTTRSSRPWRRWTRSWT